MENFDDLFLTKKQHEENSTYHAYSKDDWLLKKKKERETTFAMLKEATGKVAAETEAFTEYLDTQAKFERFSVSNCLLISLQNPKAERLADFDTWKEQEVSVSKGETGILILEPGPDYTKEDGTVVKNMNVKKVFDISQTSASERKTEPKTHEIREILKALMAESPVDLNISADLPLEMNSHYDKEEKAIHFRRGLCGNEIFRELSKQIALVKLDGKGTPDHFASYCASYVLCKRFQIPTDTFSFGGNVKKYFDGMDEKQIRSSLEKIRSVSNEISYNMSLALERKEKRRDDFDR